MNLPYEEWESDGYKFIKVDGTVYVRISDVQDKLSEVIETLSIDLSE